MKATETDTERYELIDRVAVGGMAEVYRAKVFGAHGFEKTLAIKRILPELAAEPEFEARFISEAKLAVELSHANVVQVLDFGRFAGSLFIAMEYVDGLDLAALLKWLRERNRKIPLQAAFQIAIEICRGLDFAHKHGVIHRDVSPSNILLSQAGEVKVADFGIAQAVTNRSSSEGWKKIMGKWRYMSPEQTRGEALTIQSDLFSLASMIYEMFAGEKLFPGDEAETIAHNIEAMTIPSASAVREGVPPRFDEVLFAALERNPDARTESAAVMQRQLTEICYESSILATPLDVAELVSDIIAEATEDVKAQPGSDKGDVDELIRAHLLSGGAAGELNRRTAVSEEAEEARKTAVTNAASIISRGAGSDGITVWELDKQTMAAAPSAIRRTTGRIAAIDGIEASPERAESQDSNRRMGFFLGLGVAGLALAGLLYALFTAEPDAGREVAVDASLLAPATSDAEIGPNPSSTLRIGSVPPGATVYVDGLALDGPTPTSVPVAPGTPTRVRLELAGYDVWEDADVVVPDGETLRMRPRLIRQVATLEVRSRPEGAQVFLDGEKIGLTPLTRSDLLPGDGRLLSLRKDGFRSISTRIDLKQGTPVRIERAMKSAQALGRINLQIDDGWADVYLKGRKIGRAPIQGLKLPVGKHRLRLENPLTKKRGTLEVEVLRDEVRYYRTKL